MHWAAVRVTSGGGVARDWKARPGRRKQLTVRRRRRDRWEGPVRRVLGLNVCKQTPSSSAFPSAFLSSLRAWNLRYLSQGSAHSRPLRLLSKPKIRPSNHDSRASENAAGKVFISSVHQIRPRHFLLPQHLGSGSFLNPRDRTLPRFHPHSCSCHLPCGFSGQY